RLAARSRVAAGSAVLFRCLFAASLAATLSARAFADERDVRTLPVERLRVNLLVNSALARPAADANVRLQQWVTISRATNAAPIEVRTPIGHRLATGESVLVKGVLGNVAAYGWGTVSVAAATTIAPRGST